MSDYLFEKIEKNYPEFMTSRHLIELGIYSGTYRAHIDRKNNFSPEYIQIRRKVLYPKAGVIKFLKENLVIPPKLEKNLET